MLNRFISTVVYNQRLITTTSLRLLNTSAPRLGDGDHTRSKAKDKASDDLKSGKEKRWIDTTASDSGEKNEYESSLFFICVHLYCRSGSKRWKTTCY